MEDQNANADERFAAWKVRAHKLIDEATLEGHTHILVVYGTHGDINVTGATCPGFILETGKAMLRRAVEISLDI
jgi:hypothetical protein